LQLLALLGQVCYEKRLLSLEAIIHWQIKSFVMDQSISRVRVCMAMDAALDATLSIGLSIELMIKKVVIRTAERLQKVRVLRQTSPMHMHVH